MTDPAKRRSPEATDDLVLATGMALWVVAIAVLWPPALSFSDEVAYLAQAKLVLAGHLRPLADTPGMWREGPAGRIAQFPFLLPFLLAPIFAVAPRLVFVISIGAALAVTWVVGRVLRSWGRPSFWALVVLAHPTVALIARTIMADLLLTAFVVGAWWALRTGRRPVGAVLLMLTVGLKAVGAPLAVFIVLGEALRSWRGVLSRDREAIARVVWAIAGLVLGLLLVFGMNYAASGKLWYGYDHRFLKGPPFGMKYFATSFPPHAVTLLLAPPLLFLGARPLWKKQEPGPLLIATVFVGMMWFYYFVDKGRTRVETLIMSPRLLLPALVFLLLGYTDILAGLVQRVPRLGQLLRPALVVAPAAIAFVVSMAHHRWQAPNGEAREAAAAVAREMGVHELGLTATAFKAGLLYPGPTPGVFVSGASGPVVVLCGKHSASHRDAERDVPCELAGYDVRIDRSDFRVLVRRPAP